MTKLTYSNRKSDGPKLASSVAKDLRKRGKQHSASPIELSLDGKVLTDSGAEILGPALNDALSPPAGLVVSRLQTLHLQSNALTAVCLKHLAPALAAASPDLELLDLSDNYIGVNNKETAQSWEMFLHALSQCSNLHNVNLSKNNFDNGRASEIFARVYMKQFKDAVTTYTDHLYEFDTRVGIGAGSEAEVAALEATLGALSTRDTNLGTTKSVESKMVSSGGSQKNTAQIRGLPAIAVIDLSDSFLGDNGSLFLSWVVERHRWVQCHVFGRKWGETGADSAMLFVAPNENLQAHGIQLIRQANSSSYKPPGVATVELNVGMSSDKNDESDEDWRGHHSPRKPSGSAKAAAQGVENATPGKAPSKSMQPHGQIATRPAGIGAFSNTEHEAGTSHVAGSFGSLEWLRTRIQRETIEEKGLKSVELWQTAILLLCTFRATMTQNIEGRATPVTAQGEASASKTVKAQEPVKRPSPSMEVRAMVKPLSYAAKLLGKESVMAERNVAEPEIFHAVLKKPGTHKSPRKPPIKSSSQHRKTSSEDEKRTIAEDAQGKMRMAGRLPAAFVYSTICQAVDPAALLSERQCQLILEYAQDRATLSTEMDMLGKSKSHQLWAVLEHMDVLMYEDELETAGDGDRPAGES